MKTIHFTSQRSESGLSDGAWCEFIDKGYVRAGISPKSLLDGLRRSIRRLGVEFRKIGEADQRRQVREFLRQPIFRDICARAYGEGANIATSRVILINKAPGQVPDGETVIGWHQDVWKKYRYAPWITVWTAIDEATEENGCLRVVPRSHALDQPFGRGMSGFLSEGQSRIVEACCPWEYLPCKPGESILLNNFCIHSTEHNRTDTPRRALSVCYAPRVFLR